MSAGPPSPQCPICGTELPAEATECLRCGEPLGGLASPTPADSAPSDPVVGRRERFLYYSGIALILLGGPGIAQGSWLHDVLRISYLNTDSFDVFGPVNRLVLAGGLVVMTVGTVFLLLSMRLSRPADTEAAA